jgi:hypothetical protein
MPSDLTYVGLDGPVARLAIRRSDRIGPPRIEEVLEFDPRGRLTARAWYALSGHRAARVCAITFQSDGASTEEEACAGADGWLSRHVPNLVFGCTGAVVARTLIDPSRVPIRTTFYDRESRPSSRIEYAVDRAGRIVVARQVMAIAASAADTALGAPDELESCTVTLAYDARARPMRQSAVMRDREVFRYDWEYSTDGRVTIITCSRAGKTVGQERHTDDDVDAHGNWRRRVTEHDTYRTETERAISYRPFY